MTSASVQAAVYVRERQKLRQTKKNNFRKGRSDLPTHVATKDIAPFPTFPPNNWGKAAVAWLERERKGGLSPLGEVTPHFAAHHHHHHRLKSTSEGQRNWYKRSKIHGSSFGGSSSEDLRGGLHKQYDAAANMLLYIGLCAIALGLVIAFVGTGEKGFKTVELRLIGPSIVAFGLACCLLRILFCFCPTKYMRKKFKHRHKKKNELNLSEGAELNRHGGGAFRNQQAIEYYKHLPFRSPMATNLLLFENSSMLKDSTATNNNNNNGNSNKNKNNINNKKRVSIAGKNPDANVPDFFLDDAVSDNLSTLKELSPLREEDLIDFQQSSNSYENLPSLCSSLEYLNDRITDDEEFEYARPASYQHLTSEERLSRLKSTLTFGDSNDHFIDTQLMTSYDEFDLHDDIGLINRTQDPQNKSVSFGHKDFSSELVLSAGNLKAGEF